MKYAPRAILSRVVLVVVVVEVVLVILTFPVAVRVAAILTAVIPARK